MTKRLAVALLMAAASSSAFAARKEDAVTGTASYGPGMFIQSIEAFRHFMKDGPEERYFDQRRREVNAEDPTEKPLKPLPSEPTRLAWDLGYTFNSTTTPGTAATPTSPATPDVTDTTHSFLGGLDWEALPHLDVSGEMNVDSIPEENYRHGRVALRAEYFLSLHRDPRKKAEEDAEEARIQRMKDELDARTYYQKHSEAYRREEEWLGKKLKRKPVRKDLSEDDDDDEDGGESERVATNAVARYPALRIALNVEFDRHLKEASTAARISRVPQIAGDVFLNQTGEGFELTYEPSDRWTYKLDGTFWFYDQDVNAFYQLIEGNFGGARVQKLVSSSGIGSLSNQISTFPFLTFDETATRVFNDRFSLDLALNETYYKVSGIPMSISFSPTLNVQIDKEWGVSPGASVTDQGGSFQFLGVVGVSYSW